MATPKDKRPEQERVSEAYENIRKRLEQIENDDETETSDDRRQTSDEPSSPSDKKQDDVAPTTKFEEIEEERELEITATNEDEEEESSSAKASDDMDDDEIDPLDDDDDSDDDEGEGESVKGKDKKDVEDETPLQKKGDSLEEDEDAFDDMDEGSTSTEKALDELEDEPQESLSERGEKLRESETYSKGTGEEDDRYKWKSFTADPDPTDSPEKPPKDFDDLAGESSDISLPAGKAGRQSSELDNELSPRVNSVDSPTNPGSFNEDSSFSKDSEDGDMPIPKIHHGTTAPLSALGGEERKGGLSNRPTYGSDIRPSFGADFGTRQDYNAGNKPKGSKWHLLILCVIGLVVIGATVYLLKNQFGTGGSVSSTPAPSAEVMSTPEPTPTPLPTLNPAEFKVRVLNGTETSGLAKEVMDKLTGLGYKSDKTGNASNSAFTTTLVRVKEGTSSASLLDQIIKALSPDYSASAGPALKANDNADVEVILGK